MLNTLADWNGAIDRIPYDKVNPVIGLALDEPRWKRMLSVLNHVDWMTSTVMTKEGPYLAIRSCKKLNKAELATVRAILFGVHVDWALSR